MDIEQILAAIRSLAESQGYYGRIYDTLQSVQANDPDKWADKWAEVKETLEAQNFKDTLDMIMFFET